MTNTLLVCSKNNPWLEVRPMRVPGCAERIPLSHIEMLWRRISAIYAGQFARDFKDPVQIEMWKLEWADALQQERITFKQALMALHHFRRKSLEPPSLYTFLAYASPIPDFQEAFVEARKQLPLRETGRDVWSHPAIYWAAVDFGGFELRNTTLASGRLRWAKLLNARLRLHWLPPIPTVTLASRRQAHIRNKHTARHALDGARVLLQQKHSSI